VGCSCPICGVLVSAHIIHHHTPERLQQLAFRGIGKSVHLYDADVASAPPVSSPEFWKRPERVAASSNPDTATAQTIGIMCQHAKKAAGVEGVRGTAYDAAGRFSGGGNDARSLVDSAFWWCKHFIKFVHHEFIIRQRLGESGHLQGLISPDILLQMDNPEGDCAIFSECLCAFLRVFGIPYEFVTVAVNPEEPAVFSHVYVYAVMPDGSRLPLDASHGLYPGWQVPSSDVFRLQVWDDNGRQVADHGSRFDGLGNYGFRGFGQLDPFNELPVADPTTFTPAPSDYFNPTQTFGDFGSSPWADSSTGAPYSGPAYQAPSQNSAQWAAFAASLAKSGLTLAEINAIQPGTVVGANGSILRQNPGYAVPVGSTLASSFSSLSSGNTLLYVGGALVALLVFGSMMGKK
jgi:hypothetical protein